MQVDPEGFFDTANSDVIARRDLFETRRGNLGGVRVATRQIRFRWIAASLVFLTMTKL